MSFNTPEPAENPKLQKAIDDALDELVSHEVNTDEYQTILSRIEQLYKLKLPNKERKPVDPNTLLAVGGNLAGILMILNYERVHVITSKALGFVLKAKA